MTPRDTQQARHDSPQTLQHRDRFAEVANTLEWLITAFILAFLFRSFVMEAFRIPTGSMADTLMGAHFRLGCPECGYEYTHGFVPQRYNLPEDTSPSESVQLPPVRCPSCGCVQHYHASDPARALVYNGDRILVLKCLYQFSAPKRWDVVVFKNPTNPTQNYIKRLVGLPGEMIEIVDGDLYIDGRIARKPPMVQEGLWMPIYDNDFQPMRPEQSTFNNNLRPWQMPFDLKASQWTVDREHDPTRLHLDGPADRPSVLTYGAPSANDFQASCAYNDLGMGNMPACGDLMVRFCVDFNAPTGQAGVTLTRYGIRYQGSVDAQGRMEVAQITGDERSVLDSADLKERPSGSPLLVKFSHADHQLVLQVGRQRLVRDLDGSRSAAGGREGADPRVQIFGAGRLTIAHLAIFRDIYYTSQTPHYSRPFSHATEGRPFQLRADEFFVLGDNSPNSEDARWWPEPTTATRGQRPPRAGVVPGDYLMGKALFVYWPGGFEFPWPKSIQSFAETPDQPGPLRILQELMKLRWIPNVGKMRFIYGGSSPNMGLGAADSD